MVVPRFSALADMISPIGAGTVTLVVKAPEKMVQVAPVVVGAGERGVLIRLDSLVSAVITVRDRQGRPVKSALVEVWNQARVESRASSVESVGSGNANDRGRARLLDLPGDGRMSNSAPAVSSGRAVLPRDASP